MLSDSKLKKISNEKKYGSTKPTENGFSPIEHEKPQPTQPTKNG